MFKKKAKLKYKIIDEKFKSIVLTLLKLILFIGSSLSIVFVVVKFGDKILSFIGKLLSENVDKILSFLSNNVENVAFLFVLYIVWSFFRYLYYLLVKRKYIPLTKEEIDNYNIKTIQDYLKICKKYLTFKVFFHEIGVLPYSIVDFKDSIVNNFPQEMENIDQNALKCIFSNPTYVGGLILHGHSHIKSFENNCPTFFVFDVVLEEVLKKYRIPYSFKFQLTNNYIMAVTSEYYNYYFYEALSNGFIKHI